MKDTDGHGVSIAQVNQLPQDMMCVQLNVDNFEEMIELLKTHGFRNMQGDGSVIDTGSSLTAVMLSPTGFAMKVVYHIRKQAEQPVFWFLVT